MIDPSNLTDSAGQPWAGRQFEPNANAGDDGSAPAELVAEIARYRAGKAEASDVVRIFRDSRLLIPLLAVLGESGTNAHGRIVDKSQELSIVTVEGPDGRTVLPVFSSVAAMSAWNPVARPVPASGPRVAVAAVSEGTEVVVLDPMSETEFAIRRPALWAMAQEREWIPGHLDADVVQAFVNTVVDESAVLEVTLSAGDLDGRLRGPELMIHLLLADGLAEVEVSGLVNRLTERWSNDEIIAERVDSIGVALHSVDAAPVEEDRADGGSPEASRAADIPTE